MDATTKTATFLFAARLAPLAGDDYGLKQYWRFARAFALLLAAVVLLALPKVGAAATPEDQYIRIYGLIQEVDTLHQTGAFAETLTKSQEVHAALRAFQRDYPDWNPRIVTFRLDYLASRIQTMGGQLLPLPPPNAVLAVQQQPARSTQSIVSSSALDQSKAASQLADPMQAANPIQETRSRGPKSAPSAALANQSRLTSAATVQGTNVVPAFAHARVETPEKRKDLGDYRVGDVAKEDIVTPFQLIAIDAPATATLREKEAQRTPAIFRFNPAG